MYVESKKESMDLLVQSRDLGYGLIFVQILHGC